MLQTLQETIDRIQEKQKVIKIVIESFIPRLEVNVFWGEIGEIKKQYEDKEEDLKLSLSYPEDVENIRINLEGFTNLEAFEVYSLPISELEGVDRCNALKQIIINEHNLKDWDFLDSLPRKEKLEKLWLSKCHREEFKKRKTNKSFNDYLNVIGKFKNLELLDLSYNELSGSLEPLKKLNRLRYLRIDYTKFNVGLTCLPYQSLLMFFCYETPLEKTLKKTSEDLSKKYVPDFLEMKLKKEAKKHQRERVVSEKSLI